MGSRGLFPPYSGISKILTAWKTPVGCVRVIQVANINSAHFTSWATNISDHL